MKYGLHIMLLGTALVTAACGSSQGPGDIGSKNDIVIRNAEDPPLAQMMKASKENVLETPFDEAEEPGLDPVTQAHKDAVAQAAPLIDAQAANDPDQRIVPGEPVEQIAETIVEQGIETEKQETEATVLDISKETVEETVSDLQDGVTIPEQAELSTIAKPMQTTQMAGSDLMDVNAPVTDIDTVMGSLPEIEPITEIEAAPMGTTPMETTFSDPVMEVDPATNVTDVIETVSQQPVLDLKPIPEDAMANRSVPDIMPTSTQSEPRFETMAKMPEPILEGDPAIDPSDIKRLKDNIETASALPVTNTAHSDFISRPNIKLISDVQSALKDKGYYFGAIDGQLGAETLNALHLYQNSHRMNTFGLTHETLQKLGVDTASH